MGKAFLRIILILLELESDVDAERAQEMITFKKEKGLTWGTILYGYDRKRNVLTICEDGVKKDGRLLKDTAALKIALEGYGRGDLSYHGAAESSMPLDIGCGTGWENDTFSPIKTSGCLWKTRCFMPGIFPTGPVGGKVSIHRLSPWSWLKGSK